MMNKPALKQQMRAVGADLARAADRIAYGDALGATGKLYDGLRRLAGAVGLVIDAEAPQDVLQEPVPAPVAIVTDDQVREFARPRRRASPSPPEMEGSMTKTEMRSQLNAIASRLDAARQQRGVHRDVFDVEMALRTLIAAVRSIGDAALPDGPAEAPQDVLQLAASPTSAFEPGYVRQRQEPAPAAIVTDDQVREFARPCRGPDPGVFEMLMNAAFTIETLSRDVCEGRKKIARLEQEALPPRWR